MSNQLATGTGRATFGFNAQPEKGCTDGAAKGHFNYVNHVTGLHVNGKVLNSQLIAPNTVGHEERGPVAARHHPREHSVPLKSGG